MTFETIEVSLDESAVSGFIRRYHFKESDKKEIMMLYRQVAPRVHADFHHVCEDVEYDEAAGALKKVYVVVTLGKAIDSLQESFLSRSQIQKAYMLDCIGTELLSLSYDGIDARLIQETGLYPGDYSFAGSEDLPLEMLPELMKKLGQKKVKYNEAFVLEPKKSVVFTTYLYKERKAKHTSCDSCNAVNCPNRQTSKDKKKAPHSSKKELGLVHLYTGDGKGKTTAAIGLAVRAAGSGKKVVFTQFMKGRQTSELQSLSLLPGITVIRSDRDLGWYREEDENQKLEYTEVHNNILDQIEDLIQQKSCDVLILDEITYPYNYGIIDKARLEAIMDKCKGKTEVVMTGRNPSEYLSCRADYITFMRKDRHPYDNGIKAREGIEY